MDRKKALAVAATTASVLASGIVSVAALGGTQIFGFGGDTHHTAATASPTTIGPSTAGSTPESAPTETTKPAPLVVTKYQSVLDRVVVNVPTSAPPAASPSPATSASSTGGQTTAPNTTVPPGSPTTRAPAPTVAAAPPTTNPAPTTTRPPGVPDDWPAGKPIPPMPPNCRQPQLEDDGEWNCQDD